MPSFRFDFGFVYATAVKSGKYLLLLMLQHKKKSNWNTLQIYARKERRERQWKEMKWMDRVNPFSTTLQRRWVSRLSSNTEKYHFSWITTAANLTSKWDLIDWFEICCCLRCRCRRSRRCFHCPLSGSFSRHILNLGLAKFYFTSNECCAECKSECKITKQWHKTWLKEKQREKTVTRNDKIDKTKRMMHLTTHLLAWLVSECVCLCTCVYKYEV